KLGLGEQAEKHLLERLERNDGSYLGGCFASLFPELGTRAETLWRLLRHGNSNQKPGGSVKKLPQIQERPLPANELAALLRTPPENGWVPPNLIPRAFEDLAFVVHRAGRDDLATALLKDSAWEKSSTSARILLADTMADAKKWQAAADAY